MTKQQVNSIYIRFRIYANFSKKADKRYPSRLIKSLGNLDKNLKEHKYPFRDTSTDITSKTFLPHNRKDVNPNYSEIIALISDYFNCITIWEKKLIPGYAITIKTFTVFGYELDRKLCFHYITKIINSLDAMKENQTQELRLKKQKERRKKKVSTINGNAKEIANNFWIESLILVMAKFHTINKVETNKLEQVYNYLCGIKKLNFRKYDYKGLPNPKAAHCKPLTFINRRIIVK